MGDFNESLISFVQPNGVLYDAKLPGYKNERIKNNVWEEISKNLGETIDLCKTRWKSLRTRYRKEFLKLENLKKKEKRRSVGGLLPTTNWKYFVLMSFLSEHLRNIETSSNSLLDWPEIGVFGQISDFTDANRNKAQGRLNDDNNKEIQAFQHPIEKKWIESQTASKDTSTAKKANKRKWIDEWSSISDSSNQEQSACSNANCHDYASKFGAVVAEKFRILKDTCDIEIEILTILNNAIKRQNTVP